MAKNGGIPRLVRLTGCEPSGPEWRCTLLLVHGISGDPVSSWRSPGVVWPDELASRFPGLAILSLGLGLQRIFRAGESHLEAVAETAATLLREGAVIERPVVICAYSLGGLLVKRLFADGLASDPFRRRLLNVRSIIFLGVPHRGSQWAASPLKVALGRGSSALGDLKPNARLLEDLDRRFPPALRYMGSCEFLTVRETLGPALAELHPLIAAVPGSTRVRLPVIVSSSSAELCVQRETIVDVEASHLELPRFDYPGANSVLLEINRLMAAAHDDLVSDPLGLGPTR